MTTQKKIANVLDVPSEFIAQYTHASKVNVRNNISLISIIYIITNLNSSD